jgi:hypothetical protein
MTPTTTGDYFNSVLERNPRRLNPFRRTRRGDAELALEGP